MKLLSEIMNGTASSLKKNREKRLATANIISTTPMAIKIEDESEDENDCTFASGKIEKVVESSDKSVQTDALILEEMLRKVVKDRMEQYERAAINDQFNDAQLSPMLEKLQQENKELRQYGMQLKVELQKKENEKQTLKRRFEHMRGANTSNPTSTVTSLFTSSPNTSVSVKIPTPPTFLPTSPSSVRPAHPSIHLRQSTPQVSPGMLILAANQQRFPMVSHNMNNNRPATSIQIKDGLPFQGQLKRPTQNQPLPPPLVQKIIQQQSQQQHQQQHQPQQGLGQQQPLIQIQRPNAMTPNLVPLSTLPTLPKLRASISTAENAIVLTWDYYGMLTNEQKGHFKVKHFQLLAHQVKDVNITPPKCSALWKKIGTVNALPLPMACTLTQFASGSCYFFAVVAVDALNNEGEMSNHCVIRLDINGKR